MKPLIHTPFDISHIIKDLALLQVDRFKLQLLDNECRCGTTLRDLHEQGD
jgi:hypothetical protein